MVGDIELNYRDLIKMISLSKENYSFHYDTETMAQTCRIFKDNNLHVYLLKEDLWWDLIN